MKFELQPAGIRSQDDANDDNDDNDEANAQLQSGFFKISNQDTGDELKRFPTTRTRQIKIVH